MSLGGKVRVPALKAQYSSARAQRAGNSAHSQKSPRAEGPLPTSLRTDWLSPLSPIAPLNLTAVDYPALTECPYSSLPILPQGSRSRNLAWIPILCRFLELPLCFLRFLLFKHPLSVFALSTSRTLSSTPPELTPSSTLPRTNPNGSW